MGFNSKVVSNDMLHDWEQNSNLEQPKIPMKRQHNQQQQMEKLKCPRCDSTNTKFCYYNNYNKTQPRHFCKACKRHWTKGGTLRNVPMGGVRKNKRQKTSDSATQSGTPTTPKSTIFNPNGNINQNIDTLMEFKSAQQLDNLSLSFADQKNLIPDIFYQALIQNPCSLPNITISPANNGDNGIFMGSTQNLFPFSSSDFDTNPPSLSSSFQPSNVYNYIGGSEAMEDSTITSVVPMTSNNTIQQPLHVPIPTSCAMEMPSCWNWEDIDVLVSSDLNLPWINDSEINS